uniref:N-acetyltransferase domain-containing protein n=2 Tax=Canis lupus familiaris TaxID=9615 RepID=A0A8P0NRL6_CANLF|eukprot:XP_005630617.1 N-acetyltransferase 8 isoform X2 [Canis lupus familiaris]
MVLLRRTTKLRLRAVREDTSSLTLLRLETPGPWSPMAPYHIRKYQERDRPRVLDLFSKGMEEHAPTTFCHVLKLPRTLALLLGVPLALFLASGSWLLVFVASLALLTALRFFSKYPWVQFKVLCLRSDLSDITKSYLGEPGSCFWVAEAAGQVVGMVGVLPAADCPLRREQLQLFHLCVASECRGQGVAKALLRTVLQFARDQGYSQVVLHTTMLQRSAVALYQRMGFQKTGQFFPSLNWRLFAIPSCVFVYPLPSAQASQAQGQAGGP